MEGSLNVRGRGTVARTVDRDIRVKRVFTRQTGLTVHWGGDRL